MELNLVNNKILELTDRELNAKDDGKINYIYEGDNLDCLNILKNTYLRKIDIIYIDPPYNTKKNAFIYNDTFTDDDWNIFMESRLRIVKQMLNKDGAIFISIDDNEYTSLKKICDSIFNKTNYVATVIRNTQSQRNQGIIIKVKHEYLLIYAYNNGKMLRGLTRKLEDMHEYANLDNDIDSWKASELTTRRKKYYEYDVPYLEDLTKFNRRKWKYAESEFKELMGYDKETRYEEIYKSKK